jgi:hypothetical protein
MKPVLASVSAIALALTMAGCSQASAPSSTDVAALEGTWIGENVGYENGEYQEREIRFVIEESTGTTFAGEKSWREIDGGWSAPETFSGTVIDVAVSLYSPSSTLMMRSSPARGEP